MSSLLADARHAVRALAQRPRFVIVAVLTLALGVGAATAIATTVRAVLLQPLPFRDPGQLVFLWHRTRAGDLLPAAAPDAALYAARMAGLSGLAFSDRIADAVLHSGATPPAHLRVAGVSSPFFDVLGVPAALGRTFAAGEARLPPDADPDTVTAPTVVVLSDRAWRAHFAGDSAVLGRLVRLNGRPATVIGVLAPDFVMPLPAAAGAAGAADAWTPLRQPLAAFRRVDRELDQDSDNTGVVIARLRPATSEREASLQADAVAAELRAHEPTYAAAGIRAELEPVADAAVRTARPVLAGLAVAVALTLLTAVANLGGLLIAATIGRRRELALRVALGASRWRVARMLLLESVAVGAVGGAAGVAVAAWLLPAMRGVAALGPLMERAALNGFGITAAAALSIGLGGLLGGGAALLALRTPDASLLRGGASTAAGARVTRRRLVAVQVAVTVPLLVMAGLLVRTLRALDVVPLGFSAGGVLVMDVGLRHPERHRGPADRARALSAIETGLAAVPEVRAVGAVSRAPLSGRRWATWYTADDPGTRRRADLRMITPGYFGAMGTRLLAGRTFTDAENRTEERRVAVVDRALAARFGGPLAALGRRVAIPLDGRPVSAEVVGVVESAHFESIRDRRLPAVYVPYRHEASRDLSLVVRWGGQTPAAGRVVGAAITRAEPGLVPYNVRWLADDVARTEAATRAATGVMTGFALLALMLAGMGLVAGVSMQTRTRVREFAVRAAIGATPRQLVRLAGRDGLRVLALGLLGGAALALPAGRLVRSFLFSVSPVDPLTLAGAAGAAAVLGLAAVLLPARRVTRIDPMEALRHE